MNPYVALARQTIEEYVNNSQIIDVSNDLPKEMLVKSAGVFVSLHKHKKSPATLNLTPNTSITEGELRGCIGTFLPTKPNIAEEIIDNAIAACSRDYRFTPITEDELDDLDISVDVLSQPEQIATGDWRLAIDQLDAKKYGVIIKSQDGRTGLLLPDLEGVDTPEQQIAICRQKAGILHDEPINIYKFEVTRYKEN